MAPTRTELLEGLIAEARALVPADLDGAEHVRERALMILRNLYEKTGKPYVANVSNVHFDSPRVRADSARGGNKFFSRAKNRLISVLETALEEEKTFPQAPPPESVHRVEARTLQPSARVGNEGSRRQPKAFVLMPFAGEFDWLYEELQAAGLDAGVKVERADDIFEAGIIIDQVKERIRDADIVIAVCSGRNANVFYELGIAESVHRPILIGEDKSDLPFDVQHFRAQFYGGPDGRASIRERVVRSIEETLAEKAAATPTFSTGPPIDVERQARRLRENLDVVLEDLERAKVGAIAELDNDLMSRGVLNSSMRIDGRRRIELEHERSCDRAIREWQRDIEDLGLPTPEPPTRHDED